MNIQLIKGEFNAQDALDLITQMLRIKIKYHENRITNQSDESDIKHIETKIKKLQNELTILNQNLNSNVEKVTIESFIKIEKI